MKFYLKLTGIGILAGTIFGILFKIVEFATGKKVYALLLNVDYIPYLQDSHLTEIVEFSLHLIVSISVVFVLYFGFMLLNWHQKLTPYIVANIIIAFGLFLTTLFSEVTPEITDFIAFLYWVGGHAFYGLLLGLMARRLEPIE